ncbi:MAG: hypothetical protein LBS51_03750, partial [Oscillospiraceae bacterium]|nr:hypothetical protein [Oscillospiraceae bacterium]
MFTATTALKNIRRHSRKSALYFLICVIAVSTLQIYIAVIDRTEKQLHELPGAMPVLARVASLDGSRFTGLQIPEKTVDGLIYSDHVSDLKLTVLLGGWFGDQIDEDFLDNQIGGIVGANAIIALEELNPDDVMWLPGYGPDFLGGDEAVCLMDSKLMKTCGLSLGDDAPLGLFYFKYESRNMVSFQHLDLTKLRIVGTAELSMATVGVGASSVIMPFEAVRDIFQRRDVTFYASSASFNVRDALMLNDFKAEMETLQLKSVSPYGDVYALVSANQGAALVVNDAAFISSATRLRESMSLLRGFLPLIAATLVAVGYFSAYLAVQNRREEYAVYRLLGMSGRGAMKLYFTEIAALTLSGSLFGVLLSAAFGVGGFNTGAVVFFTFP